MSTTRHVSTRWRRSVHGKGNSWRSTPRMLWACTGHTQRPALPGKRDQWLAIRALRPTAQGRRVPRLRARDTRVRRGRPTHGPRLEARNTATGAAVQGIQRTARSVVVACSARNRRRRRRPAGGSRGTCRARRACDPHRRNPSADRSQPLARAWRVPGPLSFEYRPELNGLTKSG